MDRRAAIVEIAEARVRRLTPEQRASMLLGWEAIDADDPDFASLPARLRAVLEAELPLDPMDELVEPLLCLALRRSFVGVVNGYLEACLAELGRVERVEGEVERLRGCACCGYRTLTELGFDVCPVCFWEEDGGRDPEKVSGPNRMTLTEARRNFGSIGAMSESSLAHVLPDGRARYARVDA